MNRVGGLFARIASAETLLDAMLRAARGKRTRLGVQAFLASAEEHVARLGAAIVDGTYRFGPYTSFAIRDPKSRVIRAPSFEDRVVHHALIRVVGAVFERGAIDASDACRSGRGQRASLRRARRGAQGSPAFLKIDVAKFYDSVDHRLLRRALARRFREARVLDLFDRLLDSYETRPGKGLPIGALTSQYLGNFVLDPIDRRACRQPGVRRYQRYMDDMLYFGELEALACVKREVRARLGLLELEPKGGGVLGRTEHGVPWIGFTVYPNRVRLNAPGRRRLARTLGAVERSHARGRIDDLELQARVTSMFAHARLADDVAWRRALLARRATVGEALESSEPRHPRRVVERLRQEVPVRLPQQEEAREPEQESGLPGRSAPRHGGASGPPEDAPSRARAALAVRDETRGASPAGSEICPAERPAENAPAGGRPHPARRERPRQRFLFEEGAE